MWSHLPARLVNHGAIRTALSPVTTRLMKQALYSTNVSPTRKAQRIQSFSDSVFAVFSPLALKHQAANLGQGFPDFAIDDFIKKAAQEAIQNNVNQYTRSQGHVRLCNALAQHYTPLINHPIDPMKNVVTFSGATDAIFSTMQAFINPGDEVVMFEPFYDCYPASVIMAGGKPVGVPLIPPKTTPLHSSEWKLDIQKLENSITPKTKMIMVNNPHNPTGKVFTIEELSEIARIANKHNLLVLSDEVYEFLIYENAVHNRIINLPGMWERTIYVGSAGKTFSATGWKIGWVVGEQSLVNSLHLAHQWIPFCVTTPMQEAVAVAFEQSKANNYFPEFQKAFQQRRDKLVAILADVGLEPTIPLGSYFVLAKTDKLLPHVTQSKYPRHMHDWNVCTWLTEEIGVAAIPLSAFYSAENQEAAQGYARFTFCKRDDVLELASSRLQKLKSL